MVFSSRLISCASFSVRGVALEVQRFYPVSSALRLCEPRLGRLQGRGLDRDLLGEIAVTSLDISISADQALEAGHFRFDDEQRQ